MTQLDTQGWFVTGTDTGVGKTLVACALVRGLRQRGLPVGVLKPVETGVGPAGPRDALALREAARDPRPLEKICPQHFQLPAAPPVAAAAEGRRVDLAQIHAAFAALRAAYPWRVVEGAGGVRVPVALDTSMADLAAAWKLPVLVVARAALGTWNHTRLTLDCLERAGLALAGVVISHSGGPLSQADALNLEALRSELGDRLVGEIRPLAAGCEPEPGMLELDRLLARTRRL